MVVLIAMIHVLKVNTASLHKTYVDYVILIALLVILQLLIAPVAL